MDPNQTLQVLEKEKALLEEFLHLSEQQLLMLDTENLDAVESLLDERMKVMSELTELEASIGNWIDHLRQLPSVEPETHRDLRWLNEDIVELANRVMEIDQKTCRRLEAIKERTHSELREVNQGARALSQYGSSYYLPPALDLEA